MHLGGTALNQPNEFKESTVTAVEVRPALRLISINSMQRAMVEKVQPLKYLGEPFHAPSWPVGNAVKVPVSHQDVTIVAAVIRRLASKAVVNAHENCHHSFSSNHKEPRKRARSQSMQRTAADSLPSDHASTNCVVAQPSPPCGPAQIIDELNGIVTCVRADRRQWKIDEKSRHPVLAMFPHAHSHRVSARLSRCQQLGGVALVEALLIGLEGIDTTTSSCN